MPESGAPTRTEPLGSFGSFTLSAELGRGGASTVYRARQHSLGRMVALKVLRVADGADPDYLRRFQRELRLISKLSHPNLVAVFDAGIEAGIPYVAMELLEGGTLAALLQRLGRLPWQSALSIAIQIAKGLDHLHSQNMVHRDVKPSNIFISPTGTAKLIDFGLVRPREGSGITAAGDVLGTFLYMAPEIVAGENITPAADIWALGTVTYEMLTGHRPISTEDPDLWLQALRNGWIHKPNQLVKEIPEGVSQSIMDMLVRDPARRVVSAAQQASRWEALVSTVTHPIPHPWDLPPSVPAVLLSDPSAQDSEEPTVRTRPVQRDAVHRPFLRARLRKLAGIASLCFLAVLLGVQYRMHRTRSTRQPSSASGAAAPLGPRLRRWSELASGLGRLEAGGARALEEMDRLRRFSPHDFGPNPRPWIWWLKVIRWLTNDRATPPEWRASPPMEIVELDICCHDLRRNQASDARLQASLIRWLALFPDEGFLWLVVCELLTRDGDVTAVDKVRRWLLHRFKARALPKAPQFVWGQLVLMYSQLDQQAFCNSWLQVARLSHPFEGWRALEAILCPEREALFEAIVAHCMREPGCVDDASEIQIWHYMRSCQAERGVQMARGLLRRQQGYSDVRRRLLDAYLAWGYVDEAAQVVKDWGGEKSLRLAVEALARSSLDRPPPLDDRVQMQQAETIAAMKALRAGALAQAEKLAGPLFAPGQTPLGTFIPVAADLFGSGSRLPAPREEIRRMAVSADCLLWDSVAGALALPGTSDEEAGGVLRDVLAAQAWTGNMLMHALVASRRGHHADALEDAHQIAAVLKVNDNELVWPWLFELVARPLWLQDLGQLPADPSLRARCLAIGPGGPPALRRLWNAFANRDLATATNLAVELYRSWIPGTRFLGLIPVWYALSRQDHATAALWEKRLTHASEYRGDGLWLALEAERCIKAAAAKSAARALDHSPSSGSAPGP